MIENISSIDLINFKGYQISEYQTILILARKSINLPYDNFSLLFSHTRCSRTTAQKGPRRGQREGVASFGHILDWCRAWSSIYSWWNGSLALLTLVCRLLQTKPLLQLETVKLTLLQVSILHIFLQRSTHFC